MPVENGWTGRETRLLRSALRLTVRDFADRLGVDPRTVSRWEAPGPVRMPRPEMQAALDTLREQAGPSARARFEALAASGSALSDVAAPAGTESVPDEVDRLSPDLARLVAAQIDRARQHDQAALVNCFLSAIQDCQHQDGRRGPLAALPQALSVITGLDVIARGVAGAVRRDLVSLTARSGEFVGWLYRDAGDLVRAGYWYDRAAEWALEAGDQPMQAYVLVRRSQLAYDQCDAVRVLSLAEAAAHGPWEVPSAIRAEISQQQALGLALTGAARSSVDSALDRAWEHLDDAREQEPDQDQGHLAGAVMTPATLRLRSAACYVASNRPEVGVELFREVLENGGLSRRDRGYFTARRAAALARTGDVDGAAESALACVDTATVAASGRTLRVIDELVMDLRPWRDRPTVRALAEAVD